MPECQYRCNQCQVRFRDDDGCPETLVECPLCGSRDIERLSIAGGIGEFLGKLMDSGGG